ncbi:MAG: ABC transporter substrate-binding protein [Hyphomicrobiaceae bacterium]|nr:ABC transporter substrate-binding protein [Hyphomicrobiaceae bacterium]
MIDPWTGARTRGGIATASAIAVLVAILAPPAIANAAGGVHGLSTFGKLKYPAGFTHFDYVNPDAPKRGTLSMIGSAGRITFDSFNGYILKGDAAQGLEYIFDSLMVRAADEPDAVYGLVAKSAEVAADGLSVTFHLRPEAKFADGTQLTADDVVFSFDTLKEKGHPSYRISMRDVVKAEAIDAATVRYTFKGTLVRDLPLTVASLPIFSKSYYSTRAFDQTTLEPPLGSGPYRIAEFKQGAFVVFKRRDDYWARDLAVNRGRYNFDRLKYEYYRDRTAELTNLKSGTFDFREEFTSVDWATAYDVAAVREGRLKKETLPDETPSGAQGFFINTRREKFKDLRVRKALGLAFDFEWTNKNLFYGLYRRTASYFENSNLKAEGTPGEAELALLSPYRQSLPPEIFAEAVVPPVSDGSGSDRRLLRQAANLLTEAGWEQKGAVRTNAKGEPLVLEVLIFSPSFERIIAPYLKNLRAIGVDATMRRVDPAQYERRVKSFDFDLTTQRYSMRLTPGIELKSFWGSDSATTDGSFNLAGIADPAIDGLIDKVMAATSRAELETATRAIDRVLRAGYYWVPHWFKASHAIAYWDKFSRPAVKPKYARGVIDTWWYDTEKAKRLEER